MKTKKEYWDSLINILVIMMLICVGGFLQQSVGEDFGICFLFTLGILLLLRFLFELKEGDKKCS